MIMLGGVQQLEPKPVFVLDPYKLQVRCGLANGLGGSLWVDTQPASDLLIRQIETNPAKIKIMTHIRCASDVIMFAVRVRFWHPFLQVAAYSGQAWALEDPSTELETRKKETTRITGPGHK